MGKKQAADPANKQSYTLKERELVEIILRSTSVTVGNHIIIILFWVLFCFVLKAGGKK